MTFGLRLLLGGIVCAGIGVWWFVDALTTGVMDEVFGGLVWKGPILACAGLGATYYGYHMLIGEERDNR